MRPAFLSLITILAASLPRMGQAQVPSQRQLNGFLIGQHRDAIAASFATILQVDTTSDGWIYRTYLLDRAHHAYMSFKFPQDKPDYTVSVQIAGDAGTPMRPFVGLVLGTRRDVLLARLGRPSRIEHQGDVNTDLYFYDNRNYSVEVDAQGRVSSIQILGDEGFPQPPAGGAPSLDSLLQAIQARGDGALQYLTPDFEIYRAGKTIGFRHGALLDLEADTSAMAVALFQGPNSVLTILQRPETRSDGDVNLRVWEHGGSGWVWKFPSSAPIAELVFKADAGRWRVWEIRYR